MDPQIQDYQTGPWVLCPLIKRRVTLKIGNCLAPGLDETRRHFYTGLSKGAFEKKRVIQIVFGAQDSAAPARCLKKSRRSLGPRPHGDSGVFALRNIVAPRNPRLRHNPDAGPRLPAVSAQH